MTSKKLEKTDLEHFFSLLHTAQESVIHVRRISNLNNTIDISVSSNKDEIVDQPEALRVPEIIIVICVLLLWCGSILIFIRHSELLRIRHRDLPYRSTAKPTTNLSHIAIVKRPSETGIHSKSLVSITDGLTSSAAIRPMNKFKYGGGISETESISLSPISRKRRYTRSFDLNISPLLKYSFDEHNDKEQLLNLNRVSVEIKQSLLDLHRKSMDNLASMQCLARYSTNDMSTHEPSDDQHLVVKQRRIQESPV